MPYKSEIHIAIDENPPALSLQDGTPGNPYRGQADDKGTSPDNRAWFDYVMTYKVGPNDSVRIGPGIFLTEGFTASCPPWVPKSGMRIQGYFGGAAPRSQLPFSGR